MSLSRAMYYAVHQILIHNSRLMRGIHIIFFLFLHENICCSYSLEAPEQYFFVVEKRPFLELHSLGYFFIKFLTFVQHKKHLGG